MSEVLNTSGLSVLILKGLPGSGKSTYAKELLEEYPALYKRINKDELRAMLDNSKWSKHNEKFVLKIRDALIVESLLNGTRPIIDDTNLHPKHEENIKKLISDFNKQYNKSVRVDVKVIDTPIETCIQNDLKRQNSVGEKVIRDMYDRFLAPAISIPIQDTTLPHIYIFDIDGTVAEKVNRSPYDLDKVDEDTPKENIIKIAQSLKKAGYQIVFFSGREEVCREKTERWIEKHFEWDLADYRLEMRAKGDMRKDFIVKKELYATHIEGRFYVEAVFDDRQSVVDTWRKELGLTCLQVNYGDF